MFVGEAPGYYEDVQGRPFVGQAGKLLDNLLKEIGLGRKDVFIGNVLKCRPPGNRDPLPEEIITCKPYLDKQVEIIKPKVICTLGRFGLQTICGEKMSISKVHGTLIKRGGLTLFPIYHPAAALHQPSLYDALKEDFLNLKNVLESPQEETTPEPEMSKPEEKKDIKEEKAEEKPKQLKLF